MNKHLLSIIGMTFFFLFALPIFHMTRTSSASNNRSMLGQFATVMGFAASRGN